LPNTVILDVQERCTNAPLAAVEIDAAAECEPSLGELFHEFVAECGAPDADNERIAGYFGKLLKASENDERFVVPELELAPKCDAALGVVDQDAKVEAGV
jgi:hypothetical protein